MIDGVNCRMLVVGMLTLALLLPQPVLPQSPVAVLHTEGLIHGFLVLRTLKGDTLADGDLTQVARGPDHTSLRPTPAGRW